tara:strand:+ start:3093 stop:4259 length:1167 start_codon:yes stop_codon:yes gene_type:complete
MSRWNEFIQEESEHQWLSFAVFALVIISGGIMIDWSNELSGVKLGAEDLLDNVKEDTMIVDISGDAILYETDDGRHIYLTDTEENVASPYATCLESYRGVTYACEGVSGEISVNSADIDGWSSMMLSQDLTVIDVSGNGDDLLMIVQDGTSTSLASMKLDQASSTKSVSAVTINDGDMQLDVMQSTDEGWLVAGGWKAPINFVGLNGTNSPPIYELIIEVTLDAEGTPLIEVLYLGGEGAIHSIMPAGDGFIAAGTVDSVYIEEKETTNLGVASKSATADKRGDIWFFGDIGSENVAIYSDGEISVEKLPEPLHIMPMYSYTDSTGTIAIHGPDASQEMGSLSIDTDARKSFTSLRGMMDFAFIMVSLMILSLMLWNIADSIKTGEVF